MTVEFERVTEITAPCERCFDLSLDIDLHQASLASSDERAIAGVTSGPITLGDSVTWKARHFGIWWTMTSKITVLARPLRFVDEQEKGPFARFHHEHLFAPTSSGTRMVDHISFDAPAGPIGDVVEHVLLGRHLRRLIAQRNDFLRAQAEA